jgi:hypothetical protein
VLDSESSLSINWHMRKCRRYSIEIKDSEGSIILRTIALWDAYDRRTAVAKILRLDGVFDAPSLPVRSPDQDLAIDLDAAIFSTRTPAKKKPQH